MDLETVKLEVGFPFHASSIIYIFLHRKISGTKLRLVEIILRVYPKITSSID